MKRHIDIFLLGTLWTLALLLAASFWFDTKFGFNIFLKSHWQYLASVQTGTDPVTSWFYISLVIWVLMLPLGLYLISRPYRRIRLKNEKLKSEIANKPQAIPTAQPSTPIAPAPKPVAAPSAPARPPQLKVPAYQKNTTPAPKYSEHATIEVKQETKKTSIPPVPRSLIEPNPESVTMVQKIISDAGFIVKNAPNIGGTRADALAIGADEILIVGLVCGARGNIIASDGASSTWKSDTDGEFESPVKRVLGMIERMRALFIETLDADIKITIRGFVVIDNGVVENKDDMEKIWNAFGVRVFNSVEHFREFMSGNMNRALAGTESEDFDAYSEYIDTVGEYFNSQK
ncbi:MAG: hypothetical protein FWG18_00220 [Alphaproteobacteria bacterium]|nr:hypothetical protein [Alphaproteobacteria bacterium]